jgi:hypothetical protein
MSFSGIDVRQTSDRLIFRASLKDSSNAKYAGTNATTLRLFELQSDGTLKSYDFSDNTFKTGLLATATASMTHRTGNNGSYNTGVWTYALVPTAATALTGFTRGGLYIAQVSNSSAVPPEQEREFQYGGEQGDFGTEVFLALSQDASIGSTPGGNQFGVDLASGISLNSTLFDNQGVYVYVVDGTATGQQSFATISGGKIFPVETMNLGIGDGIRLVPAPYIAADILRTPTNRVTTTGVGEVDAGSGSGGSAEDIWSYTNRSLTSTVTPSANTNTCNVAVEAQNNDGSARPFAVIEYRFYQAGTSTTGVAMPGKWDQRTTDSTGIASCEARVGDIYQYRMDAGAVGYYTATSTGSVAISINLQGHLQS